MRLTTLIMISLPPSPFSACRAPSGGVLNPKRCNHNPKFDVEFRVAIKCGRAHCGDSRIHEVGVCQDQQYLVMDYVEGPTLAELVANRPLAPPKAAICVKTIAGAVAHGAKIF